MTGVEAINGKRIILGAGEDFHVVKPTYSVAIRLLGAKYQAQRFLLTHAVLKREGMGKARNGEAKRTETCGGGAEGGERRFFGFGDHCELL